MKQISSNAVPFIASLGHLIIPPHTHVSSLLVFSYRTVARSISSCLPSAVWSSLKAQEQRSAITMGWSLRFSFQPSDSLSAPLQLSWKAAAQISAYVKSPLSSTPSPKRGKPGEPFSKAKSLAGGRGGRRVEEGSENTWRWFLCIR